MSVESPGSLIIDQYIAFSPQRLNQLTDIESRRAWVVLVLE